MSGRFGARSGVCKCLLKWIGCGSRIYSHTNIAKNSLDLLKLLDYIGFKFKTRAQPIPPVPQGSMTYMHASFRQKIFNIPQ